MLLWANNRKWKLYSLVTQWARASAGMAFNLLCRNIPFSAPARWSFTEVWWCIKCEYMQEIHLMNILHLLPWCWWMCTGRFYQYRETHETLQWRHDGRVSNHQPHDCLLNRLFRRGSKKISKLRVTGLCEGISPVTGEFPAQRANNTENVSIWWRRHD